MPASLPRLHVVTDDSVLARGDFLAVAAGVLRAGGDGIALHLRGPHTPGAMVYRMAEALLPHFGATGALLVLNDRVDVALGLGAPKGVTLGVHLGRRSLPVDETRGLIGHDVLVGLSVHDDEEVAAGRLAGADYLVFGHVHPTPSHMGERAAGTSGLASAVRAAGDVPVVAIGGMEASSVDEALDCGAFGVAALRGVWDSPAPEGAVSDYISALARYVDSSRPTQ